MREKFGITSNEKTYINAFQLTRMNFFLVQLSVSDIMTAVLTLVPEIVWTITMPAFWGGGAVCKLIKFLQVSLDQASTFFCGGWGEQDL